MIREQQLIVVNPNTGKSVNIMPVFELLNRLDPVQAVEGGFDHIGILLNDNVIRTINESWYSPDNEVHRNHDMFDLLYQLKDMFMAMERK